MPPSPPTSPTAPAPEDNPASRRSTAARRPPDGGPGLPPAPTYVAGPQRECLGLAVEGFGGELLEAVLAWRAAEGAAERLRERCLVVVANQAGDLPDVLARAGQVPGRARKPQPGQVADRRLTGHGPETGVEGGPRHAGGLGQGADGPPLFGLAADQFEHPADAG